MSIITSLAHSIKLRHRLEKSLFAPIRTWKKLTSSASFDQELHRMAHADAAQYAYEHFLDAAYYQSKLELYDHVIPMLTNRPGLCLEFGVFKAATINHFAKNCPNRLWDGFDSFEGLPESWGGGEKGKGAFSLGGKLPAVRNNVRLHRGWFDNSLPPFLKEHAGNAAFLHLDADLYSSTITVLRLCNERIERGTLLLCDEYFGQIGWRVGEHKALQEWAQQYNREIRCLAYVSNGAALFEVTK